MGPSAPTLGAQLKNEKNQKLKGILLFETLSEGGLGPPPGGELSAPLEKNIFRVKKILSKSESVKAQERQNIKLIDSKLQKFEKNWGLRNFEFCLA